MLSVKKRIPSLLQAITLLLALPAAGLSARAQDQPAAPVVETSAVDSTDYRLVPNDVVQIKVFQEADLDSILRVSKEGTITFPLIGAVTIGGKTPQDAALTIK